MSARIPISPLGGPDSPPSYPMQPFNLATDMYVPAGSESRHGVSRNVPFQHGTWRLQPHYHFASPWVVDLKERNIFSRGLLPLDSAVSSKHAFLAGINDLRFPESVRWLHVLGVYGIVKGNDFAKALIIVDFLGRDAPAHAERRGILENSVKQLGIRELPEVGKIYLVPEFTEDIAADLWIALHLMNAEWERPFYKGIVAKESDAKYLCQFSDFKRTSLRWQSYPFDDTSA